MSNEITSQVERFKALAEFYLKNEKRIYVKDVNGQYFFADIILVGEEVLTIQAFAPQHKANQKFYLPWVSVVKLEEYLSGGKE